MFLQPDKHLVLTPFYFRKMPNIFPFIHFEVDFGANLFEFPEFKEICQGKIRQSLLM
jgi:hypothetical protein